MWKGGLEERPDWDTYYLGMCFYIAQRSIDPKTVHGSVLVNKDNHVVSTGFNSPLSGCHDEDVTLDIKNQVVIHSEVNTITHYEGGRLEHATLYITGKPCPNCLGVILAKTQNLRIVHGLVKSGMTLRRDEEFQNIIKLMKYPPIIEEVDLSDGMISLLNRTINYIQDRNK